MPDAHIVALKVFIVLMLGICQKSLRSFYGLTEDADGEDFAEILIYYGVFSREKQLLII
ncbi:hypothetical protein HSBAA_61990 [Vreelandella sulfidaeris]|uniref:Uncharacterized protein n=1 Tax=Vreelandella sulfidaeris TaxID=115553 RepID=A0A455UHL4_9GAMM|nr:hypothetical protein HSBAA_61990 [Halomonas sulfidaeris]